MPRPNMSPSGREVQFSVDDIIVSKTDLTGRITYANRTFLDVSGYSEGETLGQQHNFIRHPEMPRCVFELLWKKLQAGEEIFAYVVNLTKSGDHYWVYAHVTPTRDARGQITGYHSSRRVPEPMQVRAVKGLYNQLLAEEARHQNKKDGISASSRLLNDVLEEKGMSYAEFIWTV